VNARGLCALSVGEHKIQFSANLLFIDRRNSVDASSAADAAMLLAALSRSSTATFLLRQSREGRRH